MHVRGIAVAALATTGLALAGCSTQPATDVGPDGATLNGRLVNPLPDQTLEYRFELTPTFVPENSLPPMLLGPGTLAPGADWTDVSFKATGLVPGTEYSYAVCGEFEPSGRAGCLPPKTFVTPIPASDVDEIRVAVKTKPGTVAYRPLILSVSGTTGTAKGATVFGTDALPLNGVVTCTRVAGTDATVNYRDGQTLVTLHLEDNGGAAPDTIKLSASAVSQRPATDCSPLRESEPALDLPIEGGRVLIEDN